MTATKQSILVIIFLFLGIMCLQFFISLRPLPVEVKMETNKDFTPEGYPILDNKVIVNGKFYELENYNKIKQAILDYSFKNPEVITKVETAVINKETVRDNIIIKKEVKVIHEKDETLFNAKAMNTLEYYYSANPVLFIEVINFLESKRNDSEFIETYKSKFRNLLKEVKTK